MPYRPYFKVFHAHMEACQAYSSAPRSTRQKGEALDCVPQTRTHAPAPCVPLMVLEVRPTWVLRRVLRFSSALFAEWLVEAVLHDVPHRRVVLTVSKALRGLTERERDLHGLVARSAWEALPEALACAACEPGGLAGAVISLQTFGSYANFHPVIWPEAGALEESVRRCFLDALEQGAAEPGPAARETISCSSRPRLERRSRLAI